MSNYNEKFKFKNMDARNSWIRVNKELADLENDNNLLSLKYQKIMKDIETRVKEIDAINIQQMLMSTDLAFKKSNIFQYNLTYAKINATYIRKLNENRRQYAELLGFRKFRKSRENIQLWQYLFKIFSRDDPRRTRIAMEPSLQYSISSYVNEFTTYLDLMRFSDMIDNPRTVLDYKQALKRLKFYMTKDKEKNISKSQQKVVYEQVLQKIKDDRDFLMKIKSTKEFLKDASVANDELLEKIFDIEFSRLDNLIQKFTAHIHSLDSDILQINYDKQIADAVIKRKALMQDFNFIMDFLNQSKDSDSFMHYMDDAKIYYSKRFLDVAKSHLDNALSLSNAISIIIPRRRSSKRSDWLQRKRGILQCIQDNQLKKKIFL